MHSAQDHAVGNFMGEIPKKNGSHSEKLLSADLDLGQQNRHKLAKPFK